MSSRAHSCLECHAPMVSVHRTWWQRIPYRSLYRCTACGLYEPHRRKGLRIDWSTTVRCPRCLHNDLKLQRKLDKVEGFQKSFWRSLQRLLGAKLFYCSRCRLQFYDLRPAKNPVA